MINVAAQSQTEAAAVRGPAPAAARQPRLIIENLDKSYRTTSISWGRKTLVSKLEVLKDINFTVAPGEVVTLLGPSGCGKTTLLRIIAGLGKADGGRLLLNGSPVVGPSKDKAFVFQHFGLLPWRDVLNNVAFPLELDGVSEKERNEIARKYIGLVGLSGFERHYPHSLSGGMQQRVGIARALTREPSILLMDEPFGALDDQTREVLQEELLNILAATQNTVVGVTHSISEAVLISNKVLVFTGLPGRIKRAVDIPPRLPGEPAAHSRTSPVRKEIEREVRQLLRGEERDR